MSNKIKISGIAVKEGTSRNKRKYISSELEKFAPTLNGRPILKDHEGITDNVIGKITESKFNPETTEVSYFGWIKEDGTGIVEKIRDRRISEVSIGALAGKVVKETKDSDILIPIDMEALELSTTPVPGNKGTSVGFEKKEYTEEQLKEIIINYESKSIDKIKYNYKEDKMSEQTTENKQVENTFESENTALKEKLEASEKANAELLESKKLNLIEKYNSVCEVKGISPQKLADASFEMIAFAINTAESLPVKEEAEEVKEPAEETPAEEPKKEEKPEAEPETKEPEKNESAENFEDYVITTEDVTGRGVAFYKYY